MSYTRDDAWALLTEYTQSDSLRKHALAVEAAMRFYAAMEGCGAIPAYFTILTTRDGQPLPITRPKGWQFCSTPDGRTR
jgi:hypothetical protein